MRTLFSLLAFATLCVLVSAGPTPQPTLPPSPISDELPTKIPNLRDQAAIRLQWRNSRQERVLPVLFDKYNVSMWLLVSKEYGEDTVFWSLRPPTQFAARRRTATVIFRTPSAQLPAACTRAAANLTRCDFASHLPDLWTNVQNVINLAQPANIHINSDENFAFSDGLRSGQKQLMERMLPQSAPLFTTEPRLGVEFIATRLAEMEPYFSLMNQVAHNIISDTFSDKTIVIGHTTTTDLQWVFRQRVADMGLTVWFQPNVQIIGRGDTVWRTGTIERGQLLWCDFGFQALGVNTDTQHMAYVLEVGQSEVPRGMRNALARANHMQDIVRDEIRLGRSGDEILFASLERMRAAGTSGTIYSHPIGDWGHDAGPSIGLWDLQTGVPHSGQLLVTPSTWFSVELQADVPIPEWDNLTVPFRQEEDIIVNASGVNRWAYRRQDELYLIGKQKEDDQETSVGAIVGILIFLVATVLTISCWIHRRHVQNTEAETRRLIFEQRGGRSRLLDDVADDTPSASALQGSRI